MSSFTSLWKALPQISQSRMIGSGYGLWLVWSGALNSAVSHTLKDYGCVEMSVQEGQALWFCPTSEVFRALARLQIWARLNPMPIFCQVVPVTVQVGFDLNLSMTTTVEVTRQMVDAPKEFEVWVHPKFREDVKRIPGLSLLEKSGAPGLGSVRWMLFEADEGLDYETLFSWFLAIKPVGRMGDKDSIMGWRAHASELKELLKRLKLKYLIGTREEMLLVRVAGIRSLRTLTDELLEHVATAKGDKEIAYWPTVMAAMPQRGKQFAEELLHKFNLDWNKLPPDLLHLQYRDAFMLREWFQINEIRYGGEETLESWCNLSLRPEVAGGERRGLIVNPPRRLVHGTQEFECFYCGLKSHTPPECPSKAVEELDLGVWRRLAHMDVNDFAKGLGEIDKALEDGSPLETISAMLLKGDKGPNHLLRAMFEINAPGQVRALSHVWRCRGKEWPQGLNQVAPTDVGVFMRDGLDSFMAADYDKAISHLKQARLKNQRSYIPSSLQGFLSMELGDHHQAQFCWQEAERLSMTPLQQGFFVYLQARSLEIRGEYKEAAGIYRKATTLCPAWSDPMYRSGVCMVKMGFTGQGIDIFSALMNSQPEYFNRILLDPELDRGRAHVLTALWEEWAEAEAVVADARDRVAALSEEISQRFAEDHDFFTFARRRLERMEELTKINNYAAFRELIRAVSAFESKLGQQVERDIKSMGKRVEQLTERLKDIQKEASWFPFPKLLMDFNRDFNFCVEKINWINNQHLKGADVFRRANRYVDEIEERLDNLQKRLVTLRIIRDSTLFVLLLGRSFIWFEVVGLFLSLVGLPTLIYFTKDTQGVWLVDMVRERQWDVQKGLIIILSVLALIAALVKSALQFERKKRELFERGDED